MEIVVAETDPDLMAAAIKTAAILAGQMDGQITVLSVAHVPWPAPLIASGETKRRFVDRVRAYAASADGQEVNGHLVFARESEAAYRDHVKPDSVVLIPAHSRRWSNPEERLARSLIRMHLRVILLKVK